MTDFGIVSLDDVYHPCSRMSYEGLALVRRGWINFRQKLGLIQKVCARNAINVNNLSINWSMPMMICQSAKKCLKHCSSNE